MPLGGSGCARGLVMLREHVRQGLGRRYRDAILTLQESENDRGLLKSVNVCRLMIAQLLVNCECVVALVFNGRFCETFN